MMRYSHRQSKSNAAGFAQSVENGNISASPETTETKTDPTESMQWDDLQHYRCTASVQHL
jgi:hypothetical protein